MSGLRVRTWDTDDLDAASVLLADRVRQLRELEPLLPEAYSEPSQARVALLEVLAAEGVTAAVATRGGELCGFLMGAPRPGFPGPNVWIPAAGQAHVDADVLAAMYSHLAQQWVDEGLTAHYALVPACDRASVDTWFHLVFGLQHVHAATELAGATAARVPVPDGVTVRRGRPGDIDTLIGFELQLSEHLARSPVLSHIEPQDREELRVDWVRTLGTDDEPEFVADEDGVVVAAAVGCPVTLSSAHSGLARPDEAAMLAWVVVDRQHRGRGLSRPVAQAVLDWARDSGYRSIVTDWRSANLESARAWKRFGFRDTFYRLHRNVGW
jgi:GNAT superfamily N-acetyltransferase